MSRNMSSWDGPSLNYRNPTLSSSDMSTTSSIYNGNSMLSTPLGRVQVSGPPPLPPRPVRSTTSSYGTSYGSYMSPYSNYMYGGYSPGYGGYSGGYGYGGYGYGGYRPGFGAYNSSYPESRFIQMAEESSRPAFQSIQSILHAFSSVTMMFDSSFHAIYSSYMSVLGVADNFARLRSTFGQIFSTFAIIRALNWIYKKLLFLLGISKEDVAHESIWSSTWDGVANVGSVDNANRSRRKTWPLLLFVSIMIGGPYLLFKLMSELHPHPIQEVWTPSQQPGSLAVGLYDFHAASDQELSVSPQQKLMIAPKKYQPTDCPGWLLACNENRKIGLVPNNYIGVLMQSEKTGQTYIEHNGQTYQNSVHVDGVTSQRPAGSPAVDGSGDGSGSGDNADVIPGSDNIKDL